MDYLLEWGAAPNVLGRAGAVSVVMLIQLLTNMNIADLTDSHKAPLHLCALPRLSPDDAVAMASRLLAAKADVNSTNHEGEVRLD